MSENNLSAQELSEDYSNIIPNGYLLPDEVSEILKHRRENPHLRPFVDPDGVVFPGLLFSYSRQPESRRQLVLQLSMTPRAYEIATVHTEGEKEVKEMDFEQLKRRLLSGLYNVLDSNR